MSIDPKVFPPGFLWGAATSAYQIEGAPTADGRGPSIWDRYSQQPGAIEGGDTGDVAAGHYERWAEDVALMRELGLRAYRFSISWSRVMPDGRTLNPAGLDWYERLVDALLEAGITPFVTLNHWDLPQALQERGGWTNRETLSRFVEYAAAVTQRLGDRVTHWITHNEPWVIAFCGYGWGQHAPGVRDARRALQVAHHLLVSHGMAVPVIRTNSPGAEVGIVNVHFPNRPASDSPADAAAAARADLLDNQWFLDPLFRGRYPQAGLDWYGAPERELTPLVEPGDMNLIAAPIDFLGVNAYYRRVIQADPADGLFGYQELPHPSSAMTTMSWSELDAPSLGAFVQRLGREWNVPAIYITENGLPLTEVDEPTAADGSIDDAARVDYLEQHISALAAAGEAGAPLRGYFVWCLLDTFEWNYGYRPRFGLIRVERPSLRRVPKRSFHWYRDLIRQTQ